MPDDSNSPDYKKRSTLLALSTAGLGVSTAAMGMAYGEASRDARTAQAFVDQVAAAMTKSQRTKQPVELEIGDFTLMVQPSRNKGAQR